MPIIVDLTDVKELEALEPGVYDATVFEAEERTSSTGKPMVVVTFKVQGGDFDGRKVFRNFLLLPDNLWALKQFLVALGWGREELAAQIELSLDDLKGLPCRLRTIAREYEGRMVTDVRAILPAGEEAEELAALLGQSGPIA